MPDIAWQAQAPPTRHPVPVAHLPELGVGDEVTIGVPGHYFIDGQVVALPERGRATPAGETQERDAVAVAAPFAYWLAQGFPQAGLTMQWWPVGWCWAYRDAVAAELSHEPTTAAADAASWLDHVQPTLLSPPVRRAQPARAAGALTGRTLRLQHDRGAWSWWVAVSEPVDVDGEIVVRVMSPSEYWLAQAAYEPVDNAHAVPLHRLHTYG